MQGHQKPTLALDVASINIRVETVPLWVSSAKSAEAATISCVDVKGCSDGSAPNDKVSKKLR